jgi:hypothetical protein
LTLDARLIFLGAYGDMVLSGALSTLHIIVWKFVVIAFTDQGGDGRGDLQTQQGMARRCARRFEVCLMAYAEGVRRWRLKRRRHGKTKMPAVT